MKKVLLLILSLLLAFPIFFGCAQESGVREITINEVTRSLFYAPMYVAAEKGFFEEEGLRVSIVTSGGSDKSMTALLAKEADIALMGPETAVYVKNQGKEDHPWIVAQLTKRDGSFLVGRTEGEVFDWESLRGKSVIAGRPGGMPYMTFLYLLKAHGLDPNTDVEVISNIQFPLMGGAFESGTGDYVTLFEPTASAFQAEGKGYIVANIGLESGEVPYTAFMARSETMEKDPAFLEAFVRAIYKAQKWTWSASDREIAEAVQPYFPDTDLETLTLVANNYRAADAWTQTPVMTPDAFGRLQDIIDNAGELSARVDFSELVDNRFAEKAVLSVDK